MHELDERVLQADRPPGEIHTRTSAVSGVIDEIAHSVMELEMRLDSILAAVPEVSPADTVQAVRVPCSTTLGETLDLAAVRGHDVVAKLRSILDRLEV